MPIPFRVPAAEDSEDDAELPVRASGRTEFEAISDRVPAASRMFRSPNPCR